MDNIKIKSTVLPEEQLTFEQWAKELRVGIAYNTAKLTDKANHMMSLWDDQSIIKHIKKLNLG